MKITIIYSNHYSGNFNHELLERLKENLMEEGHEIAVRDLYALDFNPVLKVSDFEGMSTGKLPEDIDKEQQFVKWADLLIFIYPVWWGGMPAILKGYIDRVFSYGFAYQSNSNGVYPLLTGKKAITMNTMGQSREEYERGMFNAMNTVNGEAIFGFCGIEVSAQLYFASIQNATPADKEDHINQAISTLRDLLPVNV